MSTEAVPGAAPEAAEVEENRKEKKKDKDKRKDKVRSAWISFVGRITAQVVGAIATVVLGLALAGRLNRSEEVAPAAASAGSTRGGAASRAATTSAIRVRAMLPLPAGVTLALGFRPSMAFSPDGRTLVFRASSEGRTRLYRRALDGAQIEPIAGTEGATAPFFSPDGEWLGFFTTTGLEKVPTAGGTRIRIADVPPVAQGAAWLKDGAIAVNRASNGGIYRVPAAGGPFTPIVALDVSRGEHGILWPQELPNGRGLLVTIVRGRDFQDLAHAEAAVVEPGTGKRRVLLEGCSFARYVPGFIVFLRGVSAFAVPFDLERLEITGPPLAAPEAITVSEDARVPHFAVSTDGALVYVHGPPLPARKSRVVRLARDGSALPLALPTGFYGQPRLSPDGGRIALMHCEALSCKLAIFDRGRGVLAPLSPEPGRFFCPAWSSDGRQVFFAFHHDSNPRLAVRAVDGSGELKTLTPRTDDAEFPNSWFPDGTLLAYTRAYETVADASHKHGTSDIWLLPADGKGPPRAWLETPFSEGAAQFSPDGRFMLYVSDENDRNEVYVRPFPGPGGKLKISTDGGSEPSWSRGGREILYRQGDAFFAVEFRPGSEPSAAMPRKLFSSRLMTGGRVDVPREYDVARDGSELIAIQVDVPEPAERHLALVTQWTTSLGRIAAGIR